MYEVLQHRQRTFGELAPPGFEVALHVLHVVGVQVRVTVLVRVTVDRVVEY